MEKTTGGGIYKSEYFMLENKRVKMSFLYPSGEDFGGFYEELTSRVKTWAEREYFEYSGRGMTYRFSACVSHSDECLTSVLCRVSLCERGRGAVCENIFVQNWVGGNLVSLPSRLVPKDILRVSGKGTALFFVDGVLNFVSSNGKIHKTDIKISDFTKNIPCTS